MAATACLGVAGVDGEVRHTAAERRRFRELATVDLDPEKRGAGEGKRERGQVGVGEVHMISRGARGRRPLAWHGASAMAHSEGEGREGETDRGPH